MGIVIVAMASTLRKPWMQALQVLMGLALMNLGIWNLHRGGKIREDMDPLKVMQCQLTKEGENGK
jgi:hypothetical protein